MNFEDMEKYCSDQSVIIDMLVDKKLLEYCILREKLADKFLKLLRRISDIVNEMPNEWEEMIFPQYVAYYLFKKGGFVNKYIHDRNLCPEDSSIKDYLTFQIESPWKFSFCEPINCPASGFYNMVDVLTKEEFFLYSPALEDILEETNGVQMIFVLMNDNGECWQTYGVVAYFQGILPSDLFFFAKQIDNSIMFNEQVYEVVENNPIPFMALFSGAQVPLVYNKKFLMQRNSSEYYEEDFDVESFSELFEIEKKHPLYKLSLKNGWSNFPHFTACYYHAKKKRLIITALTDEGYKKIVRAFNTLGYDLPEQPENNATLHMINMAKRILKIDTELNPYEESFIEKKSDEPNPELEKMNLFLRHLLDAHNANEDYDIEYLADQCDIDMDTARQLEKTAFKTLDGIDGQR